MHCGNVSQLQAVTSFLPTLHPLAHCRFDYLELEVHSRCQYDYIAAFDGATLNRTQEIGRFCGNQTTRPPVVKSKSNVMTVQFKTDSREDGSRHSTITQKSSGNRNIKWVGDTGVLPFETNLC